MQQAEVHLLPYGTLPEAVMFCCCTCLMSTSGLCKGMAYSQVNLYEQLDVPEHFEAPQLGIKCQGSHQVQGSASSHE